MTHFDAIVLGAGAAGMMCAATAGQRGRRVLLLDHATEAGRKILISGGGRCNFTNRDVRPDRFLSNNRHFARSALARYTPQDFVALVEKHRIAWHEKALGQLFCDVSAKQIVQLLLDECQAGSVDLRLSHRITAVTHGSGFVVQTDRAIFTAPALVLATGGLSIPKLGATSLSHDIAQQFGLRLTEVRPALVPLTFGRKDLELMEPLSGVSLPVRARIGKVAFEEALLFTHRGLSGPAVLQISSYWQPDLELELDLLPYQDVASVLSGAKVTRPRIEVRTALSDVLPARLAAALAPEEGKIGEVPNKQLEALAHKISNWRLNPIGTEGFAKAEVTLGGIDTRDLSSQTMMANSVPGLFAIGEAVDVTGWLGGYNFQWAWASAVAAGVAI